MINETNDFDTESFLWKTYEENDTTVENSIVIPPQRVMGEKRHIGGVIDENGNEILQARMWRERGPNKNPQNIVSLDKQINHDVKRILTGDYVFLGGIFDQYGHFLMESLARIPLESDKRKNTIHLPLYSKKMPEHVEYSLKALGVNSRPIFKTTKIQGSLTVPYPRTVIGSHYDQSQKKIFDEIRDYAVSKKGNSPKQLPTKIYLSRSRLRVDRRKITNETEIERYLTKRGFKICHMQTMSFEDQIIHMMNAEVIVGFMGSAMHSLVFSDVNSKAVFLYDGSGPSIAKNYISCDKMLGRSSTYVDVSKIIRPRYNKNRFIIDAKRLMNSLDKVL